MKKSLRGSVKVLPVCASLTSAGKPSRSWCVGTRVLVLSLLLGLAACGNSDEGEDSGGANHGPDPVALSIVTTALPAATQGTAYSVALQATGGTTPYQWDVLTGALPPGLSIGLTTGVLSGTPTASGSFSFTMRVQDSALPVAQATRPFNLTIYAPTPPFSGTFGNHTTYGAGMTPYLAHAADLNNDAKPDIVVVNPQTNQGPDGFSVLMNTGSRTFATATTYDMTGNQTYTAVAMLDLDADGLKDIVVAEPATGEVYLYKNTGTGFTYQSDISYYWNQHPQSLAVGDVDGDGAVDLVIGSYQGTQGNPTAIEVRVWNTNGTFAPTAAGSAGRSLTRIPYKLVVCNVNGDFRSDVIAMNVADSAISVMLGENSPYLMSPPVSYSVGFQALPASIAVGDINGDGFLDVASANTSDNSIALMAGNGAGAFTLQGALVTGAGPLENVAIGDLNGDGQPDIVAVNNGYGTATIPVGFGNVSVFLHQSGFAFAAKVDYAAGEHPRMALIADVDSDGKPDIVTANGGPLVITGPSIVSVLYGQ